MRRIFSSFLFPFFLLFTTTILNLTAVNAAENSEVAPLASKSLLLDITSVDSSKLVAVGQHGHILISSDGQQWQQANVPINSTLTAVYFVNKNLGWAVGHDNSILHTTDGGNNWQVQQYMPETEKPLLDIVFRNAKEGIAVGAYGLFYRTNDGGQTWLAEFHQEFLAADDVTYLAELKAEDEEAYLDEIASILPHFNRIFRDGRTLYLVGEIGLIAKSNDFGQHWQPFKDVYQGSFFDIARTHEGTLLAVGLRGHIFRSLHNGSPWQLIKSGTNALLNSIVLTDDNRVLILGNNGVILVSKDDGQTYQLQTQSDGKSLVAGVWFKGQLIAVSDVGIKIIKVK
jgi:photosystem II stability/assembly factor-like uncharacterized protein